MKNILFTLLFLLTATLGLNAQGYHLGQVITNPDGSQGVVFYLNEDCTQGWMVALHDVSTSCPWGPTGQIDGLNNLVIVNNDHLASIFSDNNGYHHTLKIREYCENIGYTGLCAANLVDFENGWYLPSAGQLKWLYVNAIFYESALQHVGEKMGLHAYWSSSVETDGKAWYVQFGAPYPLNAWAWNGYYSSIDRTSYFDHYDRSFAVRAIRDIEFSPMPIIGHLNEPAVICDEGPIELVMPNLYNADSYGWEIAEDAAFTNPVAYNGQDLDLTYDGWYLRLWATNEEGTSYSNAVRISVHETSSGYATVISCDAYEWNGQTYNESGVYQAVLVNQWGCDSIATLDLTIVHPDEYFIPYPIYACDTYVWGNLTLTESGAYEQTFTNQYGCDSTVTMSLFIKHSVEHQFTHTCCGEYEWNGQVYSESGMYQQTLPAANGCDSIVTLQLEIIDAYNFATDTTACESFVWYGHEYTQSGHYEQAFVAGNGCDSVISLNLVVWHHPEPIPEIMGLQDIFVSTEFVQNEYRYYIDSVAFATHYEWSCEDTNWIVTSAGTYCTLVANAPGTKTLKVRAWNDCGYTVQEIVIRAGFYDIEDNQAFPAKVYPNPAHDKVIIEAEGMLSVRLFDLLGQCLIKMEGDNSDRMEIDLNNLDSAIYAVEILTEQGRIVRKLNVTR